MENVFISYHHALDQKYKNELVNLGLAHGLFRDYSVAVGDIDDGLDSQTIRRIIRDDYLRDSTVTILLVGRETAGRKHVDWELKSSMIDGPKNPRSGILVINLPTIACDYYTAALPNEKEIVYPENTSWMNIDSRLEYERRYPFMPDRIVDNLMFAECKMSVVGWDRIVGRPDLLKFLVDSTANFRAVCKYDLSRKMRRNNS